MQMVESGIPSHIDLDLSDESGYNDGGASDLSSPPPPLNRARIGRYEIIYPIAQGGMAGVYAGRFTSIAGFQRLVAIKVIHSHLSSQDTFIKMFFDEARLAAGIHHPNVGEVIELGEDNGLYYMVCELILGQSLRAFLERVKELSMPVSPVLYARIASSTGFALQAAHELVGLDGEPLNLVHRDVSPRNILLTYDGFVKLIDFGIAYAHGRMSHTETGTLKGKLGYMSPEQLKSKPLDRRSDVFSLGVVLYQMVTGRQPFVGRTDIERFNKILEHRFPRPSEIVYDVSPQLEDIILRAMALRPENRYPTAGAMSADLETFIRNSTDTVDHGELSRLMRLLFNEEREYHSRKTRESQARDSAEMPVVDIIRPGERTTIPARPVRRRTSTPIKISPRTRTAIGSTMSIAALLIIFGSVSGEQAGEYPGRKSVAEKVRDKIGVFSGEPIRGNADNTPATQKEHGKAGSVSGEQTGRSAGTTSADEKAHKGDKAALSPVNASEAVQTDNPERRTAPSPASTVDITLAVSPKGANMVLDGVSIAPDTTILPLPADGRIHFLRVFSKGYLRRVARIRADADKTVSVTLKPRPWKRRLLKKQERRKAKAKWAHRTPSKKKTAAKKKTRTGGIPYL